jgi:hypothetical protein
MAESTSKISVAISLSNTNSFSADDFAKKILDLSSQISDGGYLFLMSEYSNSFTPSLSYESISLRLLMGPPNHRNTDWNFLVTVQLEDTHQQERNCPALGNG